MRVRQLLLLLYIWDSAVRREYNDMTVELVMVLDVELNTEVHNLRLLYLGLTGKLCPPLACGDTEQHQNVDCE